jgi:hypothetical protein
VEVHSNGPCQGTISASAGRNEDNQRNFEKATSEFRIRLGGLPPITKRYDDRKLASYTEPTLLIDSLILSSIKQSAAANLQ